MTEIKRYNYSSFKKEYNLDGQAFYIWIYFVNSDNNWYMTIQDINENTILAGILLRTHSNLLELYPAHRGLPSGEFQLLKQSTNREIELTYDSLGTEYKLYYIPVGEINGV